MNAWFRDLATLLCTAAIGLGYAQAKPTRVEVFDARTWSQLQASLTAPAAVVFTTTDCAHCPAVILGLAKEIQRRGLRAQLIAVVMDAAPGELDAELLRDPHYGPSDRLLAFSGQPAALRYTVNPSWRGVTPYVAFLKPGAQATWVAGPPSAEALAAWAVSP